MRLGADPVLLSHGAVPDHALGWSLGWWSFLGGDHNKKWRCGQNIEILLLVEDPDFTGETGGVISAIMEYGP